MRASLDFLTGQYEASGNRAYLETGLFLIQAFLNTGSPYETASGRRKTPPKEQGAYRYELVVTEKECFFYDVRKQKFYRFY